MTEGEEILIAARNGLEPDQCEVLETLWAKFRDTGLGVPAREIFQLLGREDGKGYVATFGRGLLYGQTENGKDVYRPTLVGALVCRHGRANEERLKQFFGLCVEMYKEEPNIETIKSGELQKRLDLSDEEIISLFGVLDLAQLWAGGKWGTKDNLARIPKDVEVIAYARDKNGPQVYFDRIIAQAWSAWGAVDESERQQLFYTAQNSAVLSEETEPSTDSADFAFIGDPTLRAQLESDWHEIGAARKVEAWKAITILSGGVLEGVLLDVLSSPKFHDEVVEFRRKENMKGLEKLHLSELVILAKHLKLVEGRQDELMRIVNDFRNLIHPARQLHEGLMPSEEEADLARSVVKYFIKQLSSMK